MLTLLHGDALSQLASMADESVQCCVTSPPYWSLRDYGIAPLIWDGKAACTHEWIAGPSKEGFTSKARWQHVVNGENRDDYPSSERGRLARDKNPEAWSQIQQDAFCSLCDSWLGNLGLEPTPDLYVQHIVQIFREVRRVLRKDGTLWLNLGDSYCSTAPGSE